MPDCESDSEETTNQNASVDDFRRLDLPLSSAFPAFTSINRRRRVVCKRCKIPIGYATNDVIHLEATRCPPKEKCKTSADDKKFETISIVSPINVSLHPNRLGDGGNPYMTLNVEDTDHNVFHADTVVCDGCESILGAKITAFDSIKAPSTCNGSTDLQETSQWYNFAVTAVEIEPFFGVVGLRELSRDFFGGERFYSEFEAIEESEKFSNDSKSWARPHRRVMTKEQVEREGFNQSWPFFAMDLVRTSELPEGLFGHLDGKAMALLDHADVFKKPESQRLPLDDESIHSPTECCANEK